MCIRDSIEAFTRAIGENFGDVVLVTPGVVDLELREVFPRVRQLVLGCPGENPIARARVFRTKLADVLERQAFDVIHFRSIFEGVPITDPSLNRGAKLIYEANGFPSIELKYHYRKVAGDDSFLGRTERQEQTCLDAADRIVTVSDVTAAYIASRGVSDQNISIIRNGVDREVFPFARPPEAKPDELLRLCYIGTLTGWQGIETLLEAVELLRKHQLVQLTIMGPQPKHRKRQLDREIERLRIADDVKFLDPASKREVCRLLHDSHFCVVPLMGVDRNTVQGCCPLKMIEAMAAGCPVVASNLPIVAELGTPNEHFAPVRSGDARNLRNVVLEPVSYTHLTLPTKA